MLKLYNFALFLTLLGVGTYWSLAPQPFTRKVFKKVLLYLTIFYLLMGLYVRLNPNFVYPT